MLELDSSDCGVGVGVALELDSSGCGVGVAAVLESDVCWLDSTEVLDSDS